MEDDPILAAMVMVMVMITRHISFAERKSQRT